MQVIHGLAGTGTENTFNMSYYKQNLVSQRKKYHLSRGKHSEALRNLPRKPDVPKEKV